MRVVIDTNVIVSGLLGSHGPPSVALSAGEAGVFAWITSRELLEEMRRVLNRPHIKRVVGDTRTIDFIGALTVIAIVVEPQHWIEASRDPDDNRVLEAGVAGDADYIVTGDRDLLALKMHAGIQVITPAAFAKLLPP